MKKIFTFFIACIVGLSVFAQVPSWSVTPTDYQYTSTLTGVLIITDTLINTPNNILGAFVNGQVRGVANPTNVGGTNIYFITMYSNVAAGDYVTFQVYIGSEDSIHNVLDSVMFTSSASFGVPAFPYELHLNLNQPAFFNSFNSYSQNVVSQYPTIDLTPYTVNNGNLPIEYTVSDIGFNLTAGVVNNSLYVTHNGNIGLDSVLISVVDSNNLSTIYDQQYMYFDVFAVNDSIYITNINDLVLGNNSTPCINLSQYLVNPDNDSITWEVITYLADSIGDTTVSWSVNPSGYQYSMNFAIEGFINGLDLQDLNYQLGVFDSGNLVGMATPQLIQGKMIYFVTAYSNSTSGTLDFKLWDSNDSILYDERTITESFVVNGIVGDLINPLQLYFGTHSYTLTDDVLCVNLFDSVPGLIDSFIVVATETNTIEQYTDTTFFMVFYQPENQPYLVGIPDQSLLAGGTFTTFDINNYLTELDGDSVLYSVIGSDSVAVSIATDGTVTLTPNSAQWIGSDTIIFVATDSTSNGLFDTDTVIFSIVPDIELTGIPNQSITTMQAFGSVALNDYLDHFYNESITYIASSNDLIHVISNDTLHTYLPFSGWVGIDTIVVSVQNLVQAMLFDTDTFIYEVTLPTTVNLPIELTPVNALSLYPSAALCFNYASNLINVDNDSIVWSVSQLSATNFVAIVDSLGEMCITITASGSFVDSVHIIVQEYGTVELYSDSSWQVINYSSDNPPTIGGIQNQTILVGNSFLTFNIDTFVTELDGDSVLYLISDTNDVTIQIDSNGVVTITPKDPLWHGSDTVRFTVMDSTINQYSDYLDVVYTVVPNIDVYGVLDQTVNYSESFSVVDLLNHLDYPYPDSLQWIVTSSELTGMVQNNQMNVYFPSSNWIGIDTLYITAMNVSNNTISDVDTAIFTVLAPSGISELVAESISIYPNPNNGSFTLNQKKVEFTKIRIRDITGRVILQRNITVQQFRIELNQSSGVYFMELSNNETNLVKRVVIK